MFDDCKSKVLQLKAMGSALIGNRLERVRFARVGRWLPATALLVIAGCSWFEEEPTPPAPSQQAKATPPAPGEGEAMAGEEAKTPDINSVPNEAPKPSRKKSTPATPSKSRRRRRPLPTLRPRTRKRLSFGARRPTERRRRPKAPPRAIRKPITAKSR